MSFTVARDVVERLGPVVGFLAAVLVLADGCGDEGVFRAAGVLISREGAHSASSLFVTVSALAAVTTAVLSLDTTVVLLTPAVIASVRAAGAPPRPALYATGHLANSASLVLPVSNLTNLLAYAVVPLSFWRFAELMWMPWLLAVAVDVVGVALIFRRDLRGEVDHDPDVAAVPLPVFATAVVVMTVAGFGIAPVLGVAPVWVATAGAAVLSGHRLATRRTTLWRVFRATAPVFCLGVLALGIVVRWLSDAGLSHVARVLLPAGSGFVSLLGVAAASALAANVVNNLPATLLLLPIAAAGGVAPALAALVGVNVGPNLTYTGSLATLLWRRAIREVDGVPRLGEFTCIGLVTVPLGLVVATGALWLSLRWFS